jgi:hypothetical protein
LLAAPAEALRVDQAGTCAAAAFVFMHGDFFVIEKLKVFGERNAFRRALNAGYYQNAALRAGSA